MQIESHVLGEWHLSNVLLSREVVHVGDEELESASVSVIRDLNSMDPIASSDE